jgi:hypothetical protein
MSAADTFCAEAARRILIKDGPYGTAIQAERLAAEAYCGGLDLLKDQKGNNDLINLTQPQIVRKTRDQPGRFWRRAAGPGDQPCVGRDRARRRRPLHR